MDEHLFTGLTSKRADWGETVYAWKCSCGARGRYLDDEIRASWRWTTHFSVKSGMTVLKPDTEFSDWLFEKFLERSGQRAADIAQAMYESEFSKKIKVPFEGYPFTKAVEDG